MQRYVHSYILHLHFEAFSTMSKHKLSEETRKKKDQKRRDIRRAVANRMKHSLPNVEQPINRSVIQMSRTGSASVTKALDGTVKHTRRSKMVRSVSRAHRLRVRERQQNLTRRARLARLSVDRWRVSCNVCGRSYIHTRIHTRT